MAIYGIAIHGGAGTVSRLNLSKRKEKAYKEVLKKAYTDGFTVLKKGGKALDAVSEAIITLENSHLFNAGRGSVLTHDGDVEMDASIMSGKNLKAGAVAGISLVKNPILLARTIMRNSKHVMLIGQQAVEFAKENGLEIETAEYFYDKDRIAQWKKAIGKGQISLDHDEEKEAEKYGTVGAVALDKKGNLAAGTSTGGMVNKMFGRVGDSAIIGAGTYANNNTCAISCTGHGEFFIRNVVAHSVSSRMELLGESLEKASEHVILKTLVKAGGRGGMIGIDKQGNVMLPFNTKGMYRGFKLSNDKEFVGIFGKEK